MHLYGRWVFKLNTMCISSNRYEWEFSLAAHFKEIIKFKWKQIQWIFQRCRVKDLFDEQCLNAFCVLQKYWRKEKFLYLNIDFCLISVYRCLNFIKSAHWARKKSLIYYWSQLFLKKEKNNPPQNENVRDALTLRGGFMSGL